MKEPTISWCAGTILFAFAQLVLAATPDVTGKWTGRTVCPLGIADFAVEVREGSGTLKHGGYGPNKVHPFSLPVRIETNQGREGHWIYFRPQDPSYRGSFNYFNGLLSPDGRTITARRGTAMAGCDELKLTRAPSNEGKQAIARRKLPICSYPTVWLDKNRECRFPMRTTRDTGFYEGCFEGCRHDRPKDVCIKHCDCMVAEFNNRELDITVQAKPEWPSLVAELNEHCLRRLR